jgi:hypothetical protein
MHGGAHRAPEGKGAALRSKPRRRRVEDCHEIYAMEPGSAMPA